MLNVSFSYKSPSYDAVYEEIVFLAKKAFQMQNSEI